MLLRGNWIVDLGINFMLFELGIKKEKKKFLYLEDIIINIFLVCLYKIV